MKRRFFLFAAPAIVAAPSLMKVSALVLPPPPSAMPSISELVTATLRARAGFLTSQVVASNAFLRQMQAVTGITPLMLGVENGVTPRIDRTAWSWWKNSAVETKGLTS